MPLTNEAGKFAFASDHATDLGITDAGALECDGAARGDVQHPLHVVRGLHAFDPACDADDDAAGVSQSVYSRFARKRREVGVPARTAGHSLGLRIAACGQQGHHVGTPRHFELFEAPTVVAHFGLRTHAIVRQERCRVGQRERARDAGQEAYDDARSHKVACCDVCSECRGAALGAAWGYGKSVTQLANIPRVAERASHSTGELAP